MLLKSIKDFIFFHISSYDLSIINSFLLNYIYVDTLAREFVLQQKVEPNRNYHVTDDYSSWYLYCHPNITIDCFKGLEDGTIMILPSVFTLDNDDIYKFTGINYYALVELYKKNTCVITLDSL